jgi:hypothetical protein
LTGIKSFVLPGGIIKMLTIPGRCLESFSVYVNRVNDKDRTLMFTADLMKRAIKGPGKKIRRIPGPTKPLLSM